MRRRSGFIWIVAGIALAILAGLLTVWLVMRVVPAAAPPELAEPEIEVVMAARYIPVREVILDDAVELRSVPASAVPDNAARSLDQITGYMAMIPISPDEIILTNQVLTPDVSSDRVGFLMAGDKLAVAFAATDLMARSGLIRPGEHVDLLFSVEVATASGDGERIVTLDALQNVEIAAMIRPGGAEVGEGVAALSRDEPATIIVALDPQDALVLKHLWDIGGTVSLALRAPGAEEPFDVEPVDMPYMVDRYELRIPVFP